MQTFLFHQGRLLLEKDNALSPQFCDDEAAIPFCWKDGERCLTKEVETLLEGYEPIGLRESYDVLGEGDYLKAGKAWELLYWNKNHRYCSRCGAELRTLTAISKQCPECGREVWPQLSAAIIVLVHRGDEILLVRSRQFKRPYFGLVAGFVEFGESIEDTVRREIMEETGLEVDDVRYFGSQPWPYPQNLMLGFMARYKSGELTLQQEELVDGGWFNIHSLPQIPKPLSMARKLIDNYIQNHK